MDEARYQNCLTFAARAPDRGIAMALEWKSAGGGIPARHCVAVGLFTLGEYREAAARFDAIADDARMGRGMPLSGSKRITAGSALVSDLFSQAANAWLLAGYLTEAEESNSKAVALAPKGSDQYYEHIIDRARISAADEDYALALEDLRLVLSAMPDRTDIQVLAATASRALGDVTSAANYLEKALALEPSNPVALVARGRLFRQIGSPNLARADWLKVMLENADTDIADEARAALEAMEIALMADKEPKNQP